MKKLVLTISILLLAVPAIFADDVTFEATAPKAVVVNQQFQLKYIINTHKAREPRLPAIEGFSIIAGPFRSQQSSTQIINGQVTSSNTLVFTYTLIADKEGEYKIAGATANINGNDYTSNPVTIKVLPPDQASAAQSSARQQRGSRSNRAAAPTNIPADDLFMTATLNKTKVFEQEAVLLSFKVYSAVNLTSLNGKIPDLKGFQIQEVELPHNKEWGLEHYKGRNYRTILWQQYVLFPQQSGEIEIPSATFEGTVAVQTRAYDPFDFFGGGGYVDVKKELRTPVLKLNVQKLPDGKPADFLGGVGSFKLSSSLSSDDVKANEAVTLRLVISGTGNMKLIKTPEVSFPEDFEVYDPKVENKISLRNDGFSGNKVIEYLVIPRFGGEYTIPAVKFSYFDIASKQYKTLETQSYTLNVTKGKESAGGTVAAYVSKEELKLLGQDIRYIKRGDVTTAPAGSYLFASITYWLWYIVPLLLFVIYILIHHKQMRENANIAAMRTKKANKVAVKRLKVAKKLLKENKKNEFYDEILKTLWGYMSDKLSIPVSQLSKENIAAELEKKGVNEELVKELHDVLNEGEFARYAPGDAGAAMDKVYNMAIEIISKMENSIKS